MLYIFLICVSHGMYCIHACVSHGMCCMYVCFMDCVVQAWELSANANFCRSETDFPRRRKIVRGEKKSAMQQQQQKKEASVLVPHQTPMKHTERVHMRYAAVAVLVE